MNTGIVVGGHMGEVLIRQAENHEFTLGELVVVQTAKTNLLLQINSLSHGSLIAQQQRELIGGMQLESVDSSLFDAELRNYIVASAKPVAQIDVHNGAISPCKVLPEMFAKTRSITPQDVATLHSKEGLNIGHVRSGGLAQEIPVHIPLRETLTHHVLVSATTGKGKSNLVMHLGLSAMTADCGLLIFDPHDEYYGRKNKGLKDHPESRVDYYTNNEVTGSYTLQISTRMIEPQHVLTSEEFSQAQIEGMYVYFKKYKNEWIEKLFTVEETGTLRDETIFVLRRRISRLLQLSTSGQQSGATFYTGPIRQTVLDQIVDSLTRARCVIIDNSRLHGKTELLVNTIITSYVYDKYRTKFQQDNLPPVSIVLEEAPRVLGKEVLAKSSNIFATIAREGRKFGVGLFAITQLPSLIPRQILANMNTKIIMGTEMALERQAIIDSAAHDLTKDHRAIASLDRGEAILSSTFVKLAVPIKIPLYINTLKGLSKTVTGSTKSISGLKS